MLVSSISQQLQALQKENEAQRRRLHLVERQKEDMLQAMKNMQSVSIANSDMERTLQNNNVERTLQQLENMATEFQSPSIQQFLEHIKRVVGSLHNQLLDTRKQMKEVKATNAVLKVCLEKSIILSRTEVDVHAEESLLSGDQVNNDDGHDDNNDNDDNNIVVD